MRASIELIPKLPRPFCCHACTQSKRATNPELRGKTRAMLAASTAGVAQINSAFLARVTPV
jgi:hypothetical protein